MHPSEITYDDGENSEIVIGGHVFWCSWMTDTWAILTVTPATLPHLWDNIP